MQIWPTRNAVPVDVWKTLLDQTHRQLDVLVYAGGFLVEAYNLVDVIRRKSADGVNFRVLLGDSRCEAVRQRGEEEGLPTLPERCQSTLEYLREVRSLDGVQIRSHQTTLYASQFRFDDAMLVNNHTYGSWAARHPSTTSAGCPAGSCSTTTPTPSSVSGPPVDQ